MSLAVPSDRLEYRFIVPSEGVLYRGETGLSQICDGLSTPSQLAFIDAMADGGASATGDGLEPLRFGDVEAAAKKKYERYSGEDIDIEQWVYACIAYFFARETKVVPTWLGSLIGAEDLKPYECLSEIYKDFRRTDRLRIVARLSTEDRVSKSDLRRDVSAQGSLNFNLRTLASKKVITIGDKIEPSGRFDKYLSELERLQRLVSEAADLETRRGIILTARHVMNDRYVLASPYATFAQAMLRMIVLEGIHEIVFPSQDGYRVLERDKALKASVAGIPGSTRIQSEQMKDYITKPWPVNLNAPVSDVAKDMDREEIELAIVTGSDKVYGVISLKDLLILNSYHDLPFSPLRTSRSV